MDMENKFLVPIGVDNENYFVILEKYKKYIGGVYIGWPGAPSGRVDGSPSRKFFDKVFAWSKKNNKIFSILFNMQAHDFEKGFHYNRINLSKYKSRFTQLTFSSIFLYREKVFTGFEKVISVNFKINMEQQLYALYKELKSLKAFVLDRDMNRNKNLVNQFYKFSMNLGLDLDIMVNEGCIPFCPLKIDHNVFITLSRFSNQGKYLRKSRICLDIFNNDFSNILKSPFLTREMLKNYKCRFFKIVGRKKPVSYIDNILNYYINGEPVDIGIAFTNMSLETGITTDMLPSSFHKKALYCKNECYKCNFCSDVYKNILNKYKVKKLKQK